MQRISLPPDDMKPTYDAVIVGSGYGAGVAASRLARMGLAVAVLERGRERVPGEFPVDLFGAAKEFQAELPFKHVGARDALFDMRVNADISVLVGCGVGGTSLINGNVMLTPDARVFEDSIWPSELRGDDALLAESYKRAAHMLGAVSYPGIVPLAKLDAFARSAEALQHKVTRPPITVTFESSPDGNAAGVHQPACTLCGDCCGGCNIGAKNTVAMNYLPDAVNHGARIFTGCSVRAVRQDADAWQVDYRVIEAKSGDARQETRTVTAGTVVLGAGTLGSTEILLRSQADGLSLSPETGARFSGNGDVIAFGYNNDVAVNAIGTGNPVPADRDPVGPVIAGLIDMRDTDDLHDGIVIQEGAIPSSLAAVMPALTSKMSALFGADTDSGWDDFWAEKRRSLTSLVKGAYTGAVHNTQVFLVMAHDGAAGRLEMRKGVLRVDWPDAGKQPVYQAIDKVLRRATAGTGGTYIPNPVWSRALGRNLVSVHPLGGCGMGEDASNGVVNHKCQVFAGDGSIHDGLYVMDGSIIPRSLGVNPSLTITALAERAMLAYADDRGLSLL